MKKRLLCILFLFVVAVTSVSLAETITASSIPAGNPTTVTLLSGTVITSDPRGMDTKTIAGYTGFGVQGGFVDGEIDLNGNPTEWVNIAFVQPTQIAEITIGFLFPNGNYGDTVNEEARVQGNFPAFTAGLVGDLYPQDATNAIWTAGVGSVTNISAGAEPYAGVWRITNPFGTNTVNSLRFFPICVGSTPCDGTNSDFAIVSVTTVPEPGALALLGTGLIGLAGAARRRLLR